MQKTAFLKEKYCATINNEKWQKEKRAQSKNKVQRDWTRKRKNIFRKQCRLLGDMRVIRCPFIIKYTIATQTNTQLLET